MKKLAVVLLLLLAVMAADPAQATCKFQLGNWKISLASENACLNPLTLGPIGYQNIGGIDVSVYSMLSGQQVSVWMYEQSVGARPFSGYDFTDLAGAAISDHLVLPKAPKITAQGGRQWAVASGTMNDNKVYAGCTLLDDYNVLVLSASTKADIEDAIVGFSASQEDEIFGTDNQQNLQEQDEIFADE